MSTRRDHSSEPSVADSGVYTTQEPPVSFERVLRSGSSKIPPPPSAQQLFYSLKREIIQTNGPSFFEREQIPPEMGFLVAKSLSEDGDIERKSVSLSFNPFSGMISIKMPSAAHEAVHDWITTEIKTDSFNSGFFTRAELNHIGIYGNRRYDNFPPPWNNTYKEPDAAIVFRGVAMPMIAVEVGYAESWPKLMADMNEIFPASLPGQTLAFYRQDFYPQGQVPPGRNPNDVVLWQIDNLRDRASWAMREEGLTPA
ncbi:hypothetical protein BDV26DRAFT_295736 [Aspergillus bertholletiae]|uniref:Uncharacterized protein n=1 Tax=Aspergillus bertholletiae TaxID=1226010 RepID=A0A5N7AXU0_9EURO|nr:hypothetical protein BDV26DRAFT_295736 [Aspergillus bertholletiae]